MKHECRSLRTICQAGNRDYLDAAPVSSRFARNENYATLVWRKFRRSVTGMIGLILVGLLLFMAVFADFVAPVEPKTAHLCVTRRQTPSASLPRMAFRCGQ